jgi:hypothetical protein
MRRILAVWAGLGVAAPLAAQAGHRVEIGSRVRLRVVGEASLRPWVAEGTVERIAGDTLTLRPSDGGPPRLIAPDRETELFTLERRAAPVGRGAAVGGVVGLIAGGLAGAAVGKECIGDDGSCLHQRHVVWERALALTGAGVLIGAVIGARSRHVWARAAWSVTPTPSPEGTGLGLGVSLHFAVAAGRSP